MKLKLEVKLQFSFKNFNLIVGIPFKQTKNLCEVLVCPTEVQDTTKADTQSKKMDVCHFCFFIL